MENERDRERDEVLVDINKLNQSLRSRTKKLEQLSGKCCIYRVLPRIREINEKAYTHALVSIGPFHHGKDEYRVMEERKGRYLVEYLKRCGLSIEQYTEKIGKLEKPLRNSYVEMTQHSREKFMEIMVVDCAFLLEYFLRLHFKEVSSNDRIWHRQRLVNDVRYDILMIENQLPFFLHESLFELFEKSNANDGASLIKVVEDAIKDLTGWDWLTTDNIINRQVENLVDFVGICLHPSLKSGERRKCDSLATPTISQLHRAGVKFKPISSKSLYDLMFNNGILQIPTLKLTDRTDIVFSNMQVYEQCHFSYKYMNDYNCIMNLLINNEEDVDLLVRNGCIENWLQDNHTAASMINGLGKSFIVNTNDFYYGGLVEDLNTYCMIP